MRSTLVYVAGPLTQGSIVANIRHACEAGLRLMRAGLSVIVPHTSAYWGQVLDDRGKPWPEPEPGAIPYDTWLAMSLELVRRCDCLLRLPGPSKGADAEVAEAGVRGLPVFHDEAALMAWAVPNGKIDRLVDSWDD